MLGTVEGPLQPPVVTWADIFVVSIMSGWRLHLASGTFRRPPVSALRRLRGIVSDPYWFDNAVGLGALSCQQLANAALRIRSEPSTNRCAKARRFDRLRNAVDLLVAVAAG